MLILTYLYFRKPFAKWQGKKLESTAHSCFSAIYMIASIRGRVIKLDLSSVHLETSSGLGYEILIPFSCHWELKKIPSGEEAFLYTFHSISDRGQKLFGFLSPRDKELFQFMKSLNGIGELTALKILSFYNGDRLYKIAQEDNKALLEKIPKVKGKTSEKILFELKQNLKKLESFLKDEKDSPSTVSPVGSNEMPSSETSHSETQKDAAILGLIQLGFDEKTAKKETDLQWNEGIQEASLIIGSILKKL